MHSKPSVAFCLFRDGCLLKKLIEASSKINGDVDDTLAARVLRIYENEREREAWLRISGDNGRMYAFEQYMRRTGGIRFQPIYNAYQSRIYRIVYDKQLCKAPRCPYLSPPPGAMVKTMVVTAHGVLVEYIISKRSLLNELRKQGCMILLHHPIEDMDYMLTRRQEYVLIQAYMKGYYSYPRRLNLADLAADIGISVSTLAELLRRAEAKIVEAFIRHELPHYLVKHLLGCHRPPAKHSVRVEAKSKPVVQYAS
ncbi:MAG: hypothetical protein GXO09_03600 [Crenarchaeota archaeon]|nr:hypothetical protein [Thermoproteota archaeon]